MISTLVIGRGADVSLPIFGSLKHIELDFFLLFSAARNLLWKSLKKEGVLGVSFLMRGLFSDLDIGECESNANEIGDEQPLNDTAMVGQSPSLEKLVIAPLEKDHFEASADHNS